MYQRHPSFIASSNPIYLLLVLASRVLGVQVAPENRRNILADLLTVYANAGKTIVFTQTKREADEVAAGIAGVIPSEVSRPVHSTVLISQLHVQRIHL